MKVSENVLDEVSSMLNEPQETSARSATIYDSLTGESLEIHHIEGVAQETQYMIGMGNATVYCDNYSIHVGTFKDYFKVIVVPRIGYTGIGRFSFRMTKATIENHTVEVFY